MSKKKRYGSQETITSRFESWRRTTKWAVIACLLMAFGVVIMAGTTLWAVTRQTEPVYFAAREDGGIIPMVAVEQPYLNDSQVTNFATEAITAAMTLNFATWRADLSSASEYFQRPAGWNGFLEAMEGSGTLDFIRNRRLISTAVANGAVVVNRGVSDGRYTWVVQVPLTVTYQSSSETDRRDYTAEIEVSRLPTWQTSRAVGITRVLLR